MHKLICTLVLEREKELKKIIEYVRAQQYITHYLILSEMGFFHPKIKKTSDLIFFMHNLLK
jgi:hypothetical protein